MKQFEMPSSKDGQKEKIAEIRKKIAKYEAMGDEAEVLELEAELRALEKGEEFDQGGIKEKTKTPRAIKSKYEILGGSSHERKREDIFIYSKGVAEYALENGIQNIVFMDKSARPAWVGIDEYWEQKFKDKPKPGFYFVNASSFVTEEFSLHGAIDERNVEHRDRMWDVEVMDQLEDLYKPLMKFKDKPLLLFDTCAHSGDTLISVKRIFEMKGFTDVRMVTATAPDEGSGVESVITFSDNGLQLCKPFFGEYAVRENDHSITSELSLNNYATETGRAVRSDIRKIIREYLK